MALAVASLCTGYGGLDLAAEALLGGELVWCAEWEDAPSVVIAARYPGVPNVRDVRAIPWWIMAPADVVTAGYPCQPFSLAGGRLGEDDPRHLWPSIAEGIGIMRPRHVLLENVRGHLSLGFDTVLHDLHRLGYAVVWRILSAAAVGACHRRERLFIYAQPLEYVAKPAGPVLAVAGEDGWLAAEEDLFGERDTYREPLPVSGVMRDGRIYSVPMPDPANEAGQLLPTPVAQPSHNKPENHLRKKPGREVVTDLAIIVENGLLATGGRLLPTPDASVANDGEGVDTWLARREKVRAKGINGNGMGMPLTIAVQMLPRTVVDFETSATDWGKYAAAVERHARMLGMAPPSPTQPNTKGNPELSPAFVEWMMCLEPGRVTDPALWTHLSPRKAREVQLRMLGNGVVPPQALAAYRQLGAVAAGRREAVAA